jgi:hypothetical protein
VKFRSITTTTFLFLLIFSFPEAGVTDEDWSIRKINPFSRRKVQDATKKDTPQTDAQKSDAEEVVARPLTATEIKKNFTRFRQQTVSAFSRTRQALVTDFKWPKLTPVRIKLPRFSSEQSEEEAISSAEPKGKPISAAKAKEAPTRRK